MTKHIFAFNHFTVKICKLIFNDRSYLQFGSSPWTSCAQIQYIVWVRYSTVELLYRASAECHRWPAVLYSTALYRTVPATTCWGRDNVCKLKRTFAIPSPATIWHWHGRRIISIIIHTPHSRRRGNTAYLCRHWRGGAAWGPVSTSSRRWTLLGVSAGEGGCPGRCGGSGDTS